MIRTLLVILFYVLCINGVYSQEIETMAVPGTRSAINQSTNKGDPPTPQNGNSSLGTSYVFSACGLGYVKASAVLYRRLAGGTAQPAGLSISGIPACAQIEKAFLYTDASGNGVAINATLQNPIGNTTVFPMTQIGTAIDKCWTTAGYNATYSYRADVTSIISGNGVYTISGLPTGATNDVDGATLIIIYRDLSASYTGNIVLADGASVVQGGVVTHNMTGFTVCGPATNATAFVIVADLQQIEDASLILNGGANTLPAGSQNFWNFQEVNTTVTAGQSTSNFQVSTSGDCFNVELTGLYYRTNCTTCTPASLSIATTQTASCGGNTGAASVSVSGGTAPYSFLWTGGSTSQTISGLAPGTYAVSISDANNCVTGSASVVVPGNNLTPSVSTSGPGVITCSNPNVVLVGTGGGSYSWSGPGIISGGNTSSPTVNQPGAYSLVVTSGVCTSSITSISISQNTTPPGASASVGSVLTCATTNVTLSSNPSGMNYNWSGPGIVSGGNTSGPAVNQPGTYNLTITDPANGCSSNTSVSVSQNITPPGAAASASGVITCAVTSVNLNGTSTGGGSFNWSGPGIVSGGSTANPTVNQPGNYNLIVTGSNGCTSAAAVNVSQNTTPPAAAASSGSTVTCTSSAVSLSASPAGFAYTWSASAGSSITGATNSQATTANGPGPYTVVVFDASNGCSASANVSPIINTTPPAATASAGSGGILTCTTLNLNLSGGPAGMNYAWSGPGIVSGASTANPVINQPGTYNLTVTNPVNGCSANASTAVSQNTVIPTVSIGPSSFTTTCASPTVQLTATSSIAAVNYNWQSPSTGSLNNSSLANPVASGIGVFTVVVTATASGCSSSAAISQVFADVAVPTVTLSSNSVELTCTTTTIGVTATATGSDLSYSWSPSPLSGGNTTTPVFNTPGSYAVAITNTVNGCNTSANLSVTINTVAPLAGVSPTQTITCVTTTVSLIATSTATSSSYSWTGPGIIGSSSTATVNVNQIGTYSVVITDNANGCTSTMATGSVINDIAIPTATVLAVSTNSTITCISPTVTLSAASTPTNVSYSWSTGSNTQSLGIVNSGVVTVTVTNLINGCYITAQYNVTGNVLLPPVVTASDTLACASTTVALLASSSNTSVSYTWSGPSATSIVQGANTASPVCSEVGTYTLVITDPTTLCSTTTTVSVIQGSVTAAFVANPPVGISPLSVNFTNQSVGAVNYDWDFGNGSTSSAVNPSQVFTGSLTYTVMLVASAGPCSDTAYATIIVDDDLIVEIPNVFTPNGDGTNDVFSIKTTGVKDIELQIFNRWGQKLYTFAGIKASWDGMTSQGTMVPDGTYFFFIKATGISGKTLEKQGTINVFK